MEQRTDLLIWIDLETTGLDVSDNMHGVHTHKIVEVGMHITDAHFNIIDPGFEVVIHHPRDQLDQVMNDFVTNMHTQSGLLDKIEHSSISLAQAEQMMIEYVASFNIAPKSSPICGNNVSFDKNFIDAQMPDFAKILHYRKIDVSSIKEIVSRQYPDTAALLEKPYKHRGLDDIKESIKELKFYMGTVFVPPKTTKNMKM